MNSGGFCPHVPVRPGLGREGNGTVLEVSVESGKRTELISVEG